MWETFTTADGLVGWWKGDGDQLALMLHGGPGLTDYTEDAADEVLAGGDGTLRVARYQQRGQSPSTTEGDFTLAQQVADAFAVMDHLGARDALVVGHSWGGHLAMHVAVADPGRVRGLLLIDALGGVGDGGLATMDPVIYGRISEAARRELATLGERGLSPDAASTEFLRLRWAGYFSDPTAAPPMPPIEASAAVGTGVLVDAIGLLEQRFLAERLPALATPSLHMIARSSPIDPDANRATAALMPGAIVEEYDTGHFIWIEQPGTVAAATRQLLRTLAG